MESILECVICLGPMVAPRVLPCGHTFCLRCLQASGLRLCPVDRLPYRPEQLAVNFVCLDLLEQANSVTDQTRKNEKKKSNVDEVLCVDCQELPAVVWCRQCDVVMCEECRSEYHSRPSLSHHNLLSILEKERLCSHHQKPLSLFCLECEHEICSCCVLSDLHQGHSTCGLISRFQEEKERLSGLLSHFGSLIEGQRKRQHSLSYDLREKERRILSLENQLVPLKTEVAALENTIKDIDSEMESLNIQATAVFQEMSSLCPTDSSQFPRLIPLEEKICTLLETFNSSLLNEKKGSPKKESSLFDDDDEDDLFAPPPPPPPAPSSRRSTSLFDDDDDDDENIFGAPPPPPPPPAPSSRRSTSLFGDDDDDIFQTPPSSSSFSSSSSSSSSFSSSPSSSSSPRFELYFRLLRLGVPFDVVRNKVIVEGFDPSLLGPDPSQRSNVPPPAPPPPPPPPPSSSFRPPPPPPPTHDLDDLFW